MNRSEFHARLFPSGTAARLRIQAGRIESIEPEPFPDNTSVWLAPGLVDLQVNGYAGVDFQQDQLTLEALLSAVRGLQSDGCTRFFFTLITDEWPALIARIRVARALRAESAELRRAIAGWHVEGPFLSPEPGYCGAHDPRCMVDPTPAHLRELRRAAGEDPVLLTLAPERAGAIEAVASAVALGMRVSLGHTNASAATIDQALAAGASAFTHLGNACPRELDRHDNILWRVLDRPALRLSLIPDQVHVSPALFRLVHRAGQDREIYYTTDAMAAAGAAPGEYPLGRMRVMVGADGIVRQPGRSNFAGSALRPVEGVCRAAEMLGESWQAAWAKFSSIPAGWMGLSSDLEIGREATFCLVEETSGKLERVTTWVAGEKVGCFTVSGASNPLRRA